MMRASLPAPSSFVQREKAVPAVCLSSLEYVALAANPLLPAGRRSKKRENQGPGQHRANNGRGRARIEARVCTAFLRRADDMPSRDTEALDARAKHGC